MSESRTMFKTSRYDDKIEPVEVVKETTCFITYMESDWRGKHHESRMSKEGGSAKFHATWGEAHAHLLTRAENAVQAARRQLELANGKLGNIKGMKQPEAFIATSQPKTEITNNNQTGE